MRKGGLPFTLEEIERAKALFASGRSYRFIGRELGRSDHAIKRALAKPEVVAEVAVIKRNLADSFEGLAERMVGSITDADILELDAYKRTLSGAIATDKAQLLKGAPTSILGVAVLLDIASTIRREDDLPQELTRTLTAPDPETPLPVGAGYAPSRSTSEPQTQTQPAKTQDPTFTVRYYTPKEIEKEVPYNPLLHGLLPDR